MGDFEVFNKEYTTTSGGALGPMDIIMPPEGSAISIHDIHISTEATGGLISLDFLTSNEEVARCFPAKVNSFSSIDDNTMGGVNESLTLLGSGLGNAQKVYLKIQYLVRGENG